MAYFTIDILGRILKFIDPTKARNTSIALGFKDYTCVNDLKCLYPIPVQTKTQKQIIEEKVEPFVLWRLFNDAVYDSITLIYQGTTYNGFDILFYDSPNFINLYLNDKFNNHHFMFTYTKKHYDSYFTSYLKFGTKQTKKTTEEMVYLARCCIRAILIERFKNSITAVQQPIRLEPADKLPNITERQYYYVEIEKNNTTAYKNVQDPSKQSGKQSSVQASLPETTSEKFNSTYYLKFEHNNTRYSYLMTVSFIENSVSQSIAVVNDDIRIDIRDRTITCTIDKNSKITYKCLVKKIQAHVNHAISTFQRLLQNKCNEKYKEMLKFTADLIVKFFKYNPAETTHHGKKYVLSLKHEEYSLPSPTILLKDTFDKFNSHRHIEIFLESNE